MATEADENAGHVVESSREMQPDCADTRAEPRSEDSRMALLAIPCAGVMLVGRLKAASIANKLLVVLWSSATTSLSETVGDGVL